MKVMIADDTQTGRLFSRAALLPVADNGDHRQQRAEAAGQIFDIREFHIGGLAIKALKDGYRPDLAIIDINFSEANATGIAQYDLDADEEISQMRGFDILDALAQYSPGTVNIFVTAYAGDDALIGEELQRRGLRLGQGYFVRTSRAIGINDLSHHLRGCLEVIANNWAEQMDGKETERLRSMETEEQIMAGETSVNGNIIPVKSLLAHTAVFHPETGAILFDQPVENLRRLLLTHLSLDLPGLFGQSFVQQAIIDFRRDEEYAAKNQEINADAMNYIRRFLQINRNAERRATLNNGFRHFYENANVGQKPRLYGERPWAIRFMNALRQRRALLGLSRLAEIPFWGLGRNHQLRNLLDEYMRLHERRATEENIRQHLYVRGLSKVAGEERLRTETHLLLPEEIQFLQETCPQLEREFRQNLANGGAP